MVNNFKRIYAEIQKEATRVGSENQLDYESVVKVVMEIVDLEDVNRIRPVARINQRVRALVESATSTVEALEGEGNAANLPNQD